MAGAGYKLFSTGDVLTAAQVNTYLMQQTVMVFANSSARTTALSGVLAEGMVSYLQDDNKTYVYDGSAWVSVGGGVPANDAATVATSQSTTSTSFTDLTTSGPAVTVTTGTKALVIVSAQIESGSEAYAAMGYAVSGASTVAANNSSSAIWRAGSTYGSPAWMRASAASVVTLTAGSNTFTAKYRVGSGTGTFENRAIFVMNLA